VQGDDVSIVCPPNIFSELTETHGRGFSLAVLRVHSAGGSAMGADQTTVDEYLQWCTTFVRTAQGTYGALAQFFICSC